MALQDDSRTVLHARRRRFTDQDVAGFVNLRFQSQFLTEVTQKVNHLLLTLRGTWHSIDSGKHVKDKCRFELNFFHIVLLN